MGRKIFYILTSVLVGITMFFAPIITHADTASSTCPDGQGKCTPLPNPLGANKDVLVILGNIISYALAIIGSLTLLMVVWGGFQWLTSAGNAEKISKGSKTMVWAMVGVFLVFASYLILNTYIDYLTGKQ